jgi:hypothetical protein
MKKIWSRILCQLFAFNMWGFAVVGPILFVAALLGLLGYLPDGASLKMMGRAVESDSDYHSFMVSTAPFGVIGWIYVWLRASGVLRFVDQQERIETRMHNKS